MKFNSCNIVDLEKEKKKTRKSVDWWDCYWTIESKLLLSSLTIAAEKDTLNGAAVVRRLVAPHDRQSACRVKNHRGRES